MKRGSHYTMPNRPGRRPVDSISLSSLNSRKRMEFKPSAIPEILQSLPPPPSLDEFCAAEATRQIARHFIQFLHHMTAKKNHDLH